MKKFAIFFLCITHIFFLSHFAIAGTPIPGDVTGDTKIDLMDAVYSLQIVAQTNAAGQNINMDADVNQDGKIGLAEVIYILQKTAGLRPASLDETPVLITSTNTSSLSIYALSGMVSAEVVSLSYTLNGGAAKIVAISDYAFVDQITLKAGTNSVCIKATDTTAAIISDSCTSIAFDPIMGVLPYSATRNYTLSGIVSSPDVKSLSYTLNGGASQPLTMMSAGQYSFFPSPLSPVVLHMNPGENSLCIRSADAAGNLIYNSCFTVVWSPVGITSADSSASSNYTLTGTAATDVASLNYTLNNGPGTAVTITQGAFSLPLVLKPGANNICMKATNAANLAGNILSDFCYTVDYAPVQFTSSAYATTSNYTLTGAISSAEVTSLSYTLNGGTAQPIDIGSNAFSMPLTLVSGINSLCTTIAVSTGSVGQACMDVTYYGAQPSSLDLIESALKAGSITAETALLYKAYSMFGDSRLPAQYKGNDGLIADYDSVLLEIYAMAPTLSPSGQDALAPFMVPPFYQGSWHDRNQASVSRATSSLRSAQDATPFCNPGWPPSNPCPLSGDWDSVGGNFVRVWFLKKNEAADKPAAQRIVSLMETQEAVWNKLTVYMGRTPMSDENTLFNGGDGRLDISLMEMGGSMKGLTVTRSANFFTADPVPVYILINRAQSLDKILFATVHEFMHAIQYNTKTPASKDNYFTLMETIAQWAGHSIFMTMDPNNKNDQTYLWAYLNSTNQAIDYKQDGRFAYGLYLFPMFLANTFGTPEGKIIKEVWDFTESSDQIHAIDRALNKHKTDLKTVWPKFALAVWNQGPVNSFKKWDKIWMDWPEKDSMDWTYETVVPNKIYPFDADLPSFSTRYSYFRFTDPSVRSVVFMNGMNFKLSSAAMRTSAGATVTGISATRLDDWTLTRGAKVQAIIKKGGKWQTPEDWSLYPYKAFCRDLTDERIEELVIILSAGDMSRKDFTPQGKPPMLYVTDTSCGPGIFQAGITCKNDSGDTKTFNVANVAYKAEGWGAGRGSQTDGKTFYSLLERGYSFKSDDANAGSWGITKTGEDAVTGGGDVKNNNISLDFATVNFATPGENAYQAYDASGSVGRLTYAFQYPCDCPGKPPSIDCSLSVDFTLKSLFDTKAKQYTRHVGGQVIQGPGTDFSDQAAGALSIGGRKPADYVCECMCPGVSGPWTCSGNWSLTSTPEP